MSQNQFGIVNFDQFVTQFMGNAAEPFQPSQQLIQVYPLSIAFSYIKAPVPLFRPTYNFLLLLTAGGGQQQVDNELLDLQANDVLFIREGHLNAIKWIDPSTNGYYIYIDSTLLPNLFERTVLNRFTFAPKHSVAEEDMNWLCQCCALIMTQRPGTEEASKVKASLLKALVLKLAETWPGNLAKADRPAEIAMRFKELLYEHFRQSRAVKFYADSLAVSENYLNRCVNQVTSKPPKQHINEMVIDHSKILLQDLSNDISQIAFDLNFSDPSYFGRLFKQVTRLTPSEYRSRFRQDLSG